MQEHSAVCLHGVCKAFLLQTQFYLKLKDKGLHTCSGVCVVCKYL